MRTFLFPFGIILVVASLVVWYWLPELGMWHALAMWSLCLVSSASLNAWFAWRDRREWRLHGFYAPWFAAVPLPVCAVDAQGQVYGSNSAFARLIGIEGGGVSGRSLARLLGEAVSAKILALPCPQAAADCPALTWITAQGQSHAWQIHSSTWLWQGKPLRMLVWLDYQPIAAWHAHAQQQYAQCQAHYDALMLSASSGCVLYRLHYQDEANGWQFLTWSPSVADVLGVMQLQDTTQLQQHLHPDDYRQWRAELLTALAHHAPYQFTARWLHPITRTWRWLQWSGVPVICEGKPTALWEGTLLDISASQQQQILFQEYQQQLQQGIAQHTAQLQQDNVQLRREIESVRQVERALLMSERNLAVLFDTAPAPILVVKIATGQIMTANLPAARWFGLANLDRLLNSQDIYQCWGDNPHIDFIFKQLYRQGEVNEYEFSMPNGKWGIISARNLVFDSHPAALVMIHDITQHKLAAQKIAQDEKKYRTIINTTPQGFCVLDKQNKIQQVNLAMCEMLGYCAADLIGQSAYLFLDEYNAKILYRQLHAANNAPQRRFYELEIIAKNGEYIPVAVYASSVFNEQSNVEFCFGFLNDVRQQKQLLHQLTEAKNHAEAANKAKSEFLTNMSHELRTPLHGILSFSDLGKRMLGRKTISEIEEYFTYITESGQRLLRILNELLDLSKLESGKMDFHFSSCDLFEIIQQVSAEMQPLLTTKQLELMIVKPVINTKAICDKARIEQVVRNLLGNAIKFSHRGGKIEISGEKSILPLQNENEVLAINIRDQGVGIPESELESVFDKFMQSSRTKTGAGGTGLGLSICREIIRGHQGEIYARPANGGGAIFTFWLPLQPALITVKNTGKYDGK